ncbi:MAG: TRAP transporter small permease [Candidatus Methylomirabilota bacterium]|jgi:TRAP-type C4-dicarboxylate transport system permease small subunit
MKRVVERLERIQMWITFAFVAILAMSVSVEVFVRYVLQKPLFLWTEELARFVLVWTVFLGIGVGVKNDAHFAMDVLPPLLGQRWGALVRLFNDLCMGLILILLVLAGLRFSWFGTFQNSPNMEILMVWVFVSIPLGGILALIYLVERIQQRLSDFHGDAP